MSKPTYKFKKLISEDQVNVAINRYPRVYDYFVDFFGILVPGITFWSVFVLIFLGLFYHFYNWGEMICANPVSRLTDYKLELIVISIVISYILGFLFFRKGTKEADINSVKKQYETIKNDNPPIKGQDDGDIDFDKDVQWPYEYLRRYLDARLPHLAQLVPWKPKAPGQDRNSQVDSDNKQEEKSFRSINRSKTFMNVLKDNIRFHLPDKYFVIARNEAHVRLSSSIWYAMRYLMVLSLISFAVVAVLFALEFIISKPPAMAKLRVYIGYSVFLTMILLFSQVIKNEIEKFLFYQRIREIVFILNTVYQACKLNPKLGFEFIEMGIWQESWFTGDSSIPPPKAP